MGYSYRNGGLITDYWPDEDATTFYIAEHQDSSLQTIIERAKEKWGNDIDLSNITIRGENMHTSCLTYDAYDPSDYTDFVVVELKD